MSQQGGEDKDEDGIPIRFHCEFMQEKTHHQQELAGDFGHH